LQMKQNTCPDAHNVEWLLNGATRHKFNLLQLQHCSLSIQSCHKKFILSNCFIFSVSAQTHTYLCILTARRLDSLIEADRELWCV
jgi:hypothetical protein